MWLKNWYFVYTKYNKHLCDVYYTISLLRLLPVNRGPGCYFHSCGLYTSIIEASTTKLRIATLFANDSQKSLDSSWWKKKLIYRFVFKRARMPLHRVVYDGDNDDSNDSNCAIPNIYYYTYHHIIIII